MGSATTSSEVFNRRIPITFNFIEQIDFGKIADLKVVGRGSFGVVYRGRWHDKLVAVKKIMSTENEKATQMEIRQLTRVNHPNIIKLYGHCIDPVCLVMEYAEDGCLHKVLHGLWIEKGEVEYTWAHAMSWALQTASGVAYLHGMRPKAIIHRDLKPANLLLFGGGKIVKIGDFGVARDKATMMTNGQGSASWMAPEVIEGVTYTEKCDVFSWAIILWELLTREKPFNEIGRDTALSIMFAICKGSRPPLNHPTLSSCPSEILTLIETCWAKDPNKRPSMDQVVQKMTSLSQLFPGAEEKLRFSAPPTPQQSLTPAKLAPGKARFQEMKAKFS